MSDEISSLRERLLKYSKWNGDCLESTYSLRRGYALARFKNKTIGAHRASWIAHKGEIPKNYFVCHRCDNKICINPNHLFLGTAKDNSEDMFRKKRDNIYSNKKKRKNYSSENLKKALRMILKGVKKRDIEKELKISFASLTRMCKKI